MAEPPPRLPFQQTFQNRAPQTEPGASATECCRRWASADPSAIWACFSFWPQRSTSPPHFRYTDPNTQPLARKLCDFGDSSSCTLCSTRSCCALSCFPCASLSCCSLSCKSFFPTAPSPATPSVAAPFPVALSPSPPAAHVPTDAPTAAVAHMETPRGEEDLAAGLRKERHAFYLKAASAARATVKMDTPKPPLRPPIQPPGLFHLLACGLLVLIWSMAILKTSRLKLQNGKTTQQPWTVVCRIRQISSSFPSGNKSMFSLPAIYDILHLPLWTIRKKFRVWTIIMLSSLFSLFVCNIF